MKSRPRLAEHALLRRHVIDGQERFVIHHAGTGALVTLDERAFEIARVADGTRDCDGIALALARSELDPQEGEIASVLGALEDNDLLAEGVEIGPLPRASAVHWVSPAPPDRAARRLVQLPGYRFRCDGNGSCCTQYASVAFAAADVRRARRVGLRTHPLDDADASRVFLPLYGGVRTERTAITLVDGRCLQLEADASCALHSAGGAAAKPSACRLYPATLTDLGDSIRVSVAAECDCVLSSLELDAEQGEPLVDASIRTGADLPDGLTVRVVADEVRVTRSRSISREDAVAWTDAAIERCAGRESLAACVHLARSLEGVASESGIESSSTDDLAHTLRPYVERIAQRMASASRAADAWRSERDRTRSVRRAVASSASTLLARGVEVSIQAAARSIPGGELERSEAFALRAGLFGLHFAESEPMADALHDFAARLLIARELAMSGRSTLGHPIAVVMAALRGG